jgi:3-oxoacyl-[acyl-carrier-protein] synthase-3
LSKRNCSVVVGTGSYLPTRRVRNKHFLGNRFYDADGEVFSRPTGEIIDKFERISGIEERRYVTDDLVASDIAFLAAKDAFASSKSDKEALDYIIVAHNFGDVRADNRRSDLVPSLAARVKQKLEIENPRTICYDIPFGCPGWLQAIIQADYYLKSGDATSALVIGTETLSRVSDPHDRDSMLYADGAGATIVEAVPGEESTGILSHAARSDTLEHARLLRMGKSYNADYEDNGLFLKMSGHKLYEYALRTVPLVVKESLDKARLVLGDVKKVLLHQANAKMDEAIVKRLYKLCGPKEVTRDVVPMTISWLGNSSVATLPTLLDLLLKRKLQNHALERGDIVVFASVGAGMNANSLVYRTP